MVKWTKSWGKNRKNWRKRKKIEKKSVKSKKSYYRQNGKNRKIDKIGKN